jgi:hypothetical protein
MRHLPRPRSTIFRIVLAMALLAWAAFAFDASVRPLAAPANLAGPVSMATGNAAPHCEGHALLSVPHASHHSAPSGKAGHGHGCCPSGGCYCASLCGGITGVPYLGVALQPMHDPALSRIHSESVLAHPAPPLRPPIT